jgi:hypothetical protein
MGSFTVIRPQDDFLTQQCARWAADFITHATPAHSLVMDLDGSKTWADQSAVLAAVAQPAGLLLYFGHGETDCWLTGGQRTIDIANVSTLAKKTVISIVCKTSCILAGAAITGNATAWLGFTIVFPILSPYSNIDPIGDALVRALRVLVSGQPVQQARDQVAAEFDQLADDFETGSLSGWPRTERLLGYYAAMNVRDHVVAHGSIGVVPL